MTEPVAAGPATDGSTESPARWGREDSPDAARERLLDAAGEVFAAKGVLAVTIADVAAAAGCARGTVYRSFADRDALRQAFVEREARRVWRRVGEQLDPDAPPAERLVDGVLVAVAEVRADPVLAAWFTGDAAVASGQLSLQAGAVRRLTGRWVRSLLADADAAGAPSEAAADVTADGTARWDVAADGTARRGLDPAVATDAVVRVILSLLTVPVVARSARAAAAAERSLVEALLVPALFPVAR